MSCEIGEKALVARRRTNIPDFELLEPLHDYTMQCTVSWSLSRSSDQDKLGSRNHHVRNKNKRIGGQILWMMRMMRNKR